MDESTCTEEQRAEWKALMDAASTLTERSRGRERDAGYTLRWALDNPDSREWAEREAWRLARGSRRAWLARVRLLALAEAQPYGREVRAALRRAARAERGAVA